MGGARMGLKRADEIRTRMDSIRSDIATPEQLDAKGEADETAVTRLDDLLAEADMLTEELAPLAAREQRIAAVTRAAQNDANIDEPDGEPTRTDRGTPELGIRKSTRSPFENL